MDSTISDTTDSVIDRFADPAAGFGDPAAGGGAEAGRVIRPSGLTGRDIEAGALVRLTRRGYDWSGTPSRGRKTP